MAATPAGVAQPEHFLDKFVGGRLSLITWLSCSVWAGTADFVAMQLEYPKQTAPQ